MKTVHPITPISQVSKKQTPIKAVLDLADVPPEAYRLPTDGRQWFHLCVQRQRIVDFLATKANPDGSNITVGASRIAKKLGRKVHRTTVQRLLADLVELGILENGNLTGNFGQMTRKRKLDIPAILARSVVKSSPSVVQSSVPAVVASSPQVVADSTPSVVASSHPVVASSHFAHLEDATQPPLRPTVEAPKVKTRNTHAFVAPTPEEVKTYCQERKNDIDPELFHDYYEEVGWIVGKTRKPMKNWRAAVRYWERNGIQNIRETKLANVQRIENLYADDRELTSSQKRTNRILENTLGAFPELNAQSRHFAAWNQLQIDGKCTGQNSLYLQCITSRDDWKACTVLHHEEPASELDKKKLYAELPALAKMRRMGAIQ